MGGILMADRHDPKPLVASLSERKLASPAFASDEPVAELAAIALGRTTSDPSPAAKAKTVPVNGVISSDIALANDLESELLKDLEAMVSSMSYAPPPSAPRLASPARLAAPVAKPIAAAPLSSNAQPAAPISPAAPPTILAAPAVAPLEKSAIEPEGQAAAVVPPSSEKAAPSVPPSQSEHQALPPASSADRPPVVGLAGGTLEMAEKLDLAALLRPFIAAHSAAAEESLAVNRSGRWEEPTERRPAEPRAAARDPGRFALAPRGAVLFGPQTAELQSDELPKMAPSGGSALVDEGPVPPDDPDAPAVYADDDGELEPFHDDTLEFRLRRPRPSLLVGGALLAVVLAAVLTYVMVESEKSVRVDRGRSAEQTRLVAPGSGKVAEVPASPGNDNNPISRIIEPAGPGFDPPAKTSEAPGSTDRLATDAAAGGDNSAQKARTLILRPAMPASDDGGKPASGAGPPSATPAADAAAADTSSHASSGATQMDAVINGRGLPIAINPDPLGINGSAYKAAADSSAGGAPAPKGLAERAPAASASDASGAAPASDNGAAGAADASAAVLAAPARVPIPRGKPMAIPDKADKPLPPPPPVAFSGDLY
jgi:hypothetical protein